MVRYHQLSSPGATSERLPNDLQSAQSHQHLSHIRWCLTMAVRIGVGCSGTLINTHVRNKTDEFGAVTMNFLACRADWKDPAMDHAELEDTDGKGEDVSLP